MKSALKFKQVSAEKITLTPEEAEALVRMHEEFKLTAEPAALSLADLADHLNASPAELAPLLARLRGVKQPKHSKFPNKLLVAAMILGAIIFWVSVAGAIVSRNHPNFRGSMGVPYVAGIYPPQGFKLKFENAREEYGRYGGGFQSVDYVQNPNDHQPAPKLDKASAIDKITESFVSLIKRDQYVLSSGQYSDMSGPPSLNLFIKFHENDWIPVHVKLPSDDISSEPVKKAIKSAIFKVWSDLKPSAPSDTLPE